METPMTQTEALQRLKDWVSAERADSASIDPVEWNIASIRGMWVFTPPGRGNTVFIVTPTSVRPVHPSQEKLADVIAELTAKPDA